MRPVTLQKRIESFCSWHRLSRAWVVLQVILFVSLCVLGVCLLCERVFYFGVARWLLAAGVGALALVSLLVGLLSLRSHPRVVAYLVDQSGGLKNLVGTGLEVANDRDETSQAILHRAERALQGRTPRSVFGFRLHWMGRHGYVPLLVVLLALFLPQMDVIGRKEREDKEKAEQLVVDKGLLKLTAKLTQVESDAELYKTIENDQITKDFDALAKSLKGTSKKEALMKLGEFEAKHRDRMAEQKAFEKSTKLLPAKPNNADLSEESREQMSKMLEKLQQGDFKSAADAMRELAKQLQSGDMSDQQKKALADELAKAMQQMDGSQVSKELAQMLREMASSPQNMNQMMKQCQQAGMNMEELAQFMESCNAMKAMGEGLSEAKAAMMGEEFQNFDAMAVEQMMAAEAGMMPGSGIGDGTGGEGKGRGGEPPEAPTDTAFKSKLSPSQVNQGKILQQLFVTGVPDKGQALTDYRRVVTSARQEASGSLARDHVPKEYEEMVKKYFDSLEKTE